MLTYSSNAQPRRKDRPWLLVILVLIWIGGATFFHAPWEPYEPFVVAVVKKMVLGNSWLVPYISVGSPYLDLQPFYFWLYALIIKIFSLSDIANAIRVINSFIILAVMYFMGKIGSRLSAFKNGRSVVLILISSVGFIINAYQLSPNLVVLLGFVLFYFALQKSADMPGISGWILSVGLTLISLNFTAEYLVIALLLLALHPLINRQWNHTNYYITLFSGVGLFALLFVSYVWQLNKVDHGFFLEWQHKYTNFIHFDLAKLPAALGFYGQTLLWYAVPCWILALWTLYKRRGRLCSDKILQSCVVFIVLLLGFALASGKQEESTIFPILIPLILLASVEIDAVRISVVALFNWFSIFVFGLGGLCIITLYFALNFGHPVQLLSKAQFFAPDYVFQFNAWQLALALLVTAIWLFMITRKHIRGREMVTNWASGSTFVLVIFVCLCLPWFNSVLSFKDVVGSSVRYLHKSGGCIATNGTNQLQSAIWYYYADVRLSPENDLSKTSCKQALITVDPGQTVNYTGWSVLWSAKRPVDTRRYVLLERTHDTNEK